MVRKMNIGTKCQYEGREGAFTKPLLSTRSNCSDLDPRHLLGDLDVWDKHPQNQNHFRNSGLGSSLQKLYSESDICCILLCEVAEAMRILTRRLKQCMASSQVDRDTNEDKVKEREEEKRLHRIEKDLIAVAVAFDTLDDDILDKKHCPSIANIGIILQSLDFACQMVRDNVRITGEQYTIAINDLGDSHQQFKAEKEQNSRLKKLLEHNHANTTKVMNKLHLAKMDKRVLSREIRRLERLRTDAKSENIILSLKLHEHLMLSNKHRSKVHSQSVRMRDDKEGSDTVGGTQTVPISPTNQQALQIFKSSKRNLSTDVSRSGASHSPFRATRTVDVEKADCNAICHIYSDFGSPSNLKDNPLPSLPSLDTPKYSPETDIERRNRCLMNDKCNDGKCMGQSSFTFEMLNYSPQVSPSFDDSNERFTVRSVTFRDPGAIGARIEKTDEGGCVIDYVVSGGQAELAGLRDGDVICISEPPGVETEQMQYDLFLALVKSKQRPLQVKIRRRETCVEGTILKDTKTGKDFGSHYSTLTNSPSSVAAWKESKIRTNP